jgi:type II secretory pathway component GspD/PulD (secretin)/tetratricopeptide (TPR) repeat protein
MKRIVLVLLAISLVVPLPACRGRRFFGSPRTSMPAAMPMPEAPPVVMIEPAPPAVIVEEMPSAPPAVIIEEMPPAPPAVVVEEMPPAPPAVVVEEMPPAPPAFAEEPPAPAPAPAPEVDLLEQARRAAEIESQKRDVMIASLLQKADEALASGDLDAARGYYDQVLNLDPANAAARKGQKLLAMDRESSVGEFLDTQRGVEMVRRQQAAAEVRGYLERGRTFEAREDFDAAIKEYQKALAVISWYTDQRDFGTTSDAVRDLIENARYKAEIAQRRDREQQIAAARMERERELISERERRLGTIASYFEQANLAFQRGEFALAREYANAILRWDPQNGDARSLVEITYEAQHIRNTEEARRLFDDQWKSVMSDLKLGSLPQVATVEFPDDWLDGIARRKPRVVGDSGPVEDSSMAAIYTTLETKRVKGLNWEEANLDSVVNYLRTITGLNFFISQKVRAEKFDEVVVTLQLDDVSVKTVLDLVTDPYELKWEPRGGVVTIATADEIRGQMGIRYFDVKDLNVAIQNFVGREINLVPSNFTPPEPPELPEPTPIFPQDSLVELIRETIGQEGAWDDPATIEARNGIIIARNTAPILNQVQALLDELRSNSGLLVNLEVRFMTAEDNFLRDVGVDIRGLGDNAQGIGAPGLGTNRPQDDVFFGNPANPYGVPLGVRPEPSSGGTRSDSGIFYNDGADGAYQARVENLFDRLLGNPQVLTGSGGLSFQHTFLDDTQIEVILRAVEKSERIQQITASRITVYNTQRANVSVLNQVSYVQDYEVEIAQASNIANPVIQTIQDGVVLDVRPVVSADRRFVTLELRPTVALLTRPIATFATSLSSGPVTANAPVVIQIPQLRVSRVRTTVVMPDGATLLLGGLKFYEQANQESGIPLLSDIPVLGFLFSRKGEYVNRRNLLILISAEIVPLEEREPKSDLNIPAEPSATFVPLREEPAEAQPSCTAPPTAGAPATPLGPPPVVR